MPSIMHRQPLYQCRQCRQFRIRDLRAPAYRVRRPTYSFVVCSFQCYCKAIRLSISPSTTFVEIAET